MFRLVGGMHPPYPPPKSATGYPYYKGSPCATTEIITKKFDVLRGRLLGNHNDRLPRWDLKARNSAVQLCAYYDSSFSQESTTKDVKLFGYDFRGHTTGTL